MSEEGSFLTRWSRRKAAARTPPAPVELAEPPLDLPPIESLGANSDYSLFLVRGVSRAIQTQALSKAWTSDPAIADFRGMAEYAWDFNAPGYAELAAGDDAAVWLSQIVRSSAKHVLEPAPSAGAEDGAAQDGAQESEQNSGVAQDEAPSPPLFAAVSESDPAVASTDKLSGPALDGTTVASLLPEVSAHAAPIRRRHGGAVPI